MYKNFQEKMACSPLQYSLQPLIGPTFEMLILTQRLQLSHDDLLALCQRFSVSYPEMLRTTCGVVAHAIKYLLNFQKTDQWQNSALVITLTGKYNDLSHVMTFLPLTGQWWMLDAYIGCRELECKPVDLQSVFQKIHQLTKTWNPTIWIDLSGCSEPEPSNQEVKATLQKYTFDLSNISQRYQQLVNESSRRGKLR